MAYRDTARDVVDPVEAPMVEAEPFLLRETGRVDFTSLEDQVIALASRDGIGSLQAPGPIERLVAFLFGVNLRRRQLADPRLEALRRAVVIARHRRHLPDAQAADLRAAGFTLAQIHALEVRATAL